MHAINFGYHIASEDLESRKVKILAIIKCPEKYSALKESLSSLIDELKTLTFFNVAQRNFTIDWCFGGDLKIDNIFYGIDSCNCNFFCVWCLCKASERADFSKFWSMLDTKGQPRTV